MYPYFWNLLYIHKEILSNYIGIRCLVKHIFPFSMVIWVKNNLKFFKNGSVTFCIVHFRIVTFGIGNILYGAAGFGHLHIQIKKNILDLRSLTTMWDVTHFLGLWGSTCEKLEIYCFNLVHNIKQVCKLYILFYVKCMMKI